MVILYRDGRKEHVRGPHALFEDPVKHQSVEVKDVMSVDAFEALVVYRYRREGRRGKRRGEEGKGKERGRGKRVRGKKVKARTKRGQKRKGIGEHL